MKEGTPPRRPHRYSFFIMLAFGLGIAAVVSAPAESSFFTLCVKAIIPTLVIIGLVWVMNRITSPAESPTKEVD